MRDKLKHCINGANRMEASESSNAQATNASCAKGWYIHTRERAGKGITERTNVSPATDAQRQRVLFLLGTSDTPRASGLEIADLFPRVVLELLGLNDEL
jgi:hypothetical protein